MEKNWLIRTKDLQILGPVSIKKIKELLEKKSLNPEDEICSGNGYWFFIKEEELVERYIRQEEKQGFNPISEAETVLSNNSVSQNKQAPTEDESDDITVVGLTLDALKASEDVQVVPTEAPDFIEDIQEEFMHEEKEEPVVQTPKVSVKTIQVKKEQGVAGPSNSFFTGQRFLYFLVILFLCLSGLAFFYRKLIIKELIGLS